MTSHAAFAPFYLPAHPHYFAPASALLPPPPLLLSQWKPVKNPAFLSVESLIAKSECVDPPEDEEEEEEEEELSVCLTPPPPPPPPARDQSFVYNPHESRSTMDDAESEEGGTSATSAAATQRNCKNTTRERRQEANARERSRVNTISAAFENLRSAVPSFSHGQRLSKLTILRVASAYIMALGQLADGDLSTPTLSQCVDLCTTTLMKDGQSPKARPSPPQDD